MNARNFAPGDNTRKPGPGAYSPEKVNKCWLFLECNLFVDNQSKSSDCNVIQLIQTSTQSIPESLIKAQVNQTHITRKGCKVIYMP